MFPSPRSTALGWARLFEARVVFSVAAVVVLSAAVRFWIAARTNVPWILPDELIYTDLARSFSQTGHFAVRGEPFSAWSFGPLYPVAIAPAFGLVQSLSGAYLAVKAVNSSFSHPPRFLRI